MIKQLLELAGVAHLPKAKCLIELTLLHEGFKEAQTEFTHASSEQEAQERISQFRDLVNRNQVQGNERNIDYWRKQGWEEFSQFVIDKSQVKSQTQEKRAKNPGKSITVYEDSEWLVVVPLDKDASCFHGKNTDWCTTKPYKSYFESYFYRSDVTLIYFLKLDTGDKWAIACYSDGVDMDLFDKNDRQISVNQFNQQTGLNAVYFHKKVIRSRDVKVATTIARDTFKAAEKRVIEALSNIDSKDMDVERDLMFIKDPELIVRYCKTIGQRWPKVEKFIANHPDEAVDYAEHLIKGRWPEAERSIMQSSRAMVDYVKTILGEQRWPEAERYMIDRSKDIDGSQALFYATKILKRRWPEAEQLALSTADDLIMKFNAVADDEYEANKIIQRLQTLASTMYNYERVAVRGQWAEARQLYTTISTLDVD